MKTVIHALLFAGLLAIPCSLQAQNPTGSEEAICQNSAVLACDNFETRTIPCDMSAAIFKFPWPGWGLPANPASTTCRIQPMNTQHFDGSRSAEFHYLAMNNDQNGGTGWIEHVFPAQNEVYIRWYVKYSSNFVFPLNNTGKQVAISNMSTNSVHIGHMGAEHVPHVVVQDGGGAILNQNQNGTPITVANDRWYCFEFRLVANTSPATANGILEGWIDGVKKWSYNAVLFQTSGDMVFRYFMITGSGFNGTGGGSTPEQYRWVDNVVVSAKRIGAIGWNGDTTAVSAPTSLTAKAVSLSQINLSWADNSNNESGFQVEYKVSPTGNWVLLATTAPNTTTYSKTGLGANHTFYFRVNATNANGSSAYTNEVSASTSVTKALRHQPSTHSRDEIGINTKTGSSVFTFPWQGAYTLSVCNISGREVFRLCSEATARQGVVEWQHGTDFRQGVYVARLQQGKICLTQKFILN